MLYTNVKLVAMLYTVNVKLMKKLCTYVKVVIILYTIVGTFNNCVIGWCVCLATTPATFH